MKNTLIALLTIVLLAVSSVAFAAEFSFGDIGAVSFAVTMPIAVAVVLGNGNLSKVKNLLDDCKNEEGWNRVSASATTSGSKVVELLLNDYADYMDYMNNMDKDRKTALMLAAKKGQSEVVELLLEHDAKDYVDKNGMGILLLAVSNNRTKLTKMLLTKGHVDVNCTDSEGFTALMWVSKNMSGDREIAKMLLEHGADLDIMSRSGQTATKLAKNKPTLIAMFLQHIKDVVERFK